MKRTYPCSYQIEEDQIYEACPFEKEQTILFSLHGDRLTLEYRSYLPHVDTHISEKFHFVRQAQPSKALASLPDIPKNIPDALAVIRRWLKETGDLESFRKLDEESANGTFHFQVGLWARNDFGLWAGYDLAGQFARLGITHPDSMSGLLITSLWRLENGKPANLKGQVAEFMSWIAEKVLNEEASATVDKDGISFYLNLPKHGREPSTERILLGIKELDASAWAYESGKGLRPASETQKQVLDEQLAYLRRLEKELNSLSANWPPDKSREPIGFEDKTSVEWSRRNTLIGYAPFTYWVNWLPINLDEEYQGIRDVDFANRLYLTGASVNDFVKLEDGKYKWSADPINVWENAGLESVEYCGDFAVVDLWIVNGGGSSTSFSVTKIFQLKHSVLWTVGEIQGDGSPKSTIVDCEESMVTVHSADKWQRWDNEMDVGKFKFGENELRLLSWKTVTIE
jgi:hypothetical protein